MSATILDTGELIGLEHNDRRVVAIVARALEHHDPLLVAAGVVVRAWRDGRRQARLSLLLGAEICQVVSLDDRQTRASGQICGTAGTSDVVGSSMVVVARDHRAGVVTSDLDDLRRLDPRLDISAL